MKNIFILLICVVFLGCGLAFAQDVRIELTELAKQATVENFPEAGGVILLDEVEAKVKPDGSANFRLYRAVKILNDRGKSFGEVALSYNKSFESIKLNFARTIKNDGTVLPVSEEAIQDSSPYLNYPLYSDIMIKSMSLSGIEPDCIVEYEAEIEEKRPILEKGFNSVFYLKAGEPYLLQRIAIHIPSSLEAKFITKRFEIEPKPEILEKDDYKTYLWEIKDMQEIIYEPLMPPLEDVSPYIAISTINDWKDIGAWYKEISEVQTAADEAIKNKVQELTNDLVSQEEKTEVIYYFILQNIRYVAIELEDSAFKPHNASDVFKNRYGDCKDKVTLLISMLKEIGVPCHYALVRTSEQGKMDLGIPTLRFNHAIACIPKEKGFMFLDPTAETAMFGNLPSFDQGVDVLVVDENPKLVRTDVFSPEKNVLVSTTKMRINADLSLDYAETTKVAGENDTYWRAFVRFSKPVDLKRFFQAAVNGICPGAKLQGYDIGDYKDMKSPMQLKLNFSSKDFATKAGNLVSFSIPGSDTFAAGFVGLEKRQYPIQYTSLNKTESKALILIPKGFSIRHLPEDVSVKFPSGYFMAKYSKFGEDIVYKSIFVRDQLEVGVENYFEYKTMMEKIARDVKSQIVLEAK